MFFKTHVRWVELISKFKFQGNYIENQIYPVNIDGRSCLVTKHQMDLRVFDDTCPNQEISLREGLCKEGQIICPWHKYAFCLESGKDLSSSGTVLKVYHTKLENDYLYVGIEEGLPFWINPV